MINSYSLSVAGPVREPEATSHQTIRLGKDPAHARQVDWYAWLVVVAIFDAVCTSIILHLGGYEANPLAAAVIHRGGILGMAIYRVAIVATILVLCEWLWNRSPAHARMAILTSLIISVPPVAIGLAQIAVHRFS